LDGDLAIVRDVHLNEFRQPIEADPRRPVFPEAGINRPSALKRVTAMTFTKISERDPGTFAAAATRIFPLSCNVTARLSADVPNGLATIAVVAMPSPCPKLESSCRTHQTSPAPARSSAPLLVIRQNNRRPVADFRRAHRLVRRCEKSIGNVANPRCRSLKSASDALSIRRDSSISMTAAETTGIERESF
jgi:hypothetical protein